jgi:protocatechuate 3,4-dioxygenase beta subunit
MSTTTNPSCAIRPQQTQGPYFVDEKLNRSDIRSDPTTGVVKEGVPLQVTFDVSKLDSSSSCSPLSGAAVDVWHCDALGQYSDVLDTNLGFDTTGQKFLRGYQLTDQNGAASFTTIYPGWYQGRTVHIHFKIRTDPQSEQGFEFTSQLYFDDYITDQVFTRPPYSTKGPRTIRNAQDGIFLNGGTQLLLSKRKRTRLCRNIRCRALIDLKSVPQERFASYVFPRSSFTNILSNN